MGKYRTIGTDLNRNYRNDLNLNFEEIDKDIKAGVAETKRVETETKETIDNIVGGGFIEGLENARDNANTSAINADTKAALANAKADYANTQGLYAKEQGDYAKLQGTYAKDKAVEADTAANKAIAETSNLDVLKIAVTDATQAAGVAAGEANASATAADTATGKANTAAGKADTATGKADVAADNANAKATLAQQAADNANAEATGLEALKVNVTAATDDAVTAAELANTEASGLSVMKDAVSAATLAAEGASTQATEQAGYAKLQGDFAKGEGAKVALETGNLTEAKAAVESATSQAVTAAGSADTAKQAADVATTNADAATLKANSAATNADDKALIAQTAADNADAKALQAETQAAHAKTQGDYAKAQGDAVQGVFDAGLVASVNGKTGAVVLGATDVGADTSLQVDDKVQDAKDYTDSQIALIPEVDISGKVDKEVGKGLSTNDYTTAEKNKLTGIEAGANKYTHPATHPASMITESITKRFVSDAEKSDWNAKETPSGAQAKVDALGGIGNNKTVKQAYDRAEEAFTSASNGKQAIKSAITGIDPEVVIPVNPTFADLSLAIGNISSVDDSLRLNLINSVNELALM